MIKVLVLEPNKCLGEVTKDEVESVAQSRGLNVQVDIMKKPQNIDGYDIYVIHPPSMNSFQSISELRKRNPLADIIIRNSIFPQKSILRELDSSVNEITEKLDMSYIQRAFDRVSRSWEI
ncbi:MAG: hypothetical protein AABX11_05475 [Nanoarchaeota archaeon]